MTEDRTDDTDPSSPNWAGSFTTDYYMFVRDGIWNVHDAETGEYLSAMAVCEPWGTEQ